MLTRPVLITVASYAMLAFLEMSSLALIPLVWSTPIEFGGLNLSPLSIGLWTSAFGCISGILQFVLFPRAVGRFGVRPVFVAGVATCAVVFAMFPLENLVLRHSVEGRQNMTVWLLILLQLGSLSINKMGFGKCHLRL
jgi:MFS family permease